MGSAWRLHKTLESPSEDLADDELLTMTLRGLSPIRPAGSPGGIPVALTDEAVQGYALCMSEMASVRSNQLADNAMTRILHTHMFSFQGHDVTDTLHMFGDFARRSREGRLAHFDNFLTEAQASRDKFTHAYGTMWYAQKNRPQSFIEIIAVEDTDKMDLIASRSGPDGLGGLYDGTVHTEIKNGNTFPSLADIRAQAALHGDRYPGFDAKHEWVFFLEYSPAVVEAVLDGYRNTDVQLSNVRVIFLGTGKLPEG